MNRFFKVAVSHETNDCVDIDIGFVGESTNDQIVVDAVAGIKELGLRGGPLVRFNGPVSIPVAMALAHAVAHLYGAVAVKDPKLGKFVVAISHRPDMPVGQLLEP
jgi:CRISPR-associated protein Csx3